MPDAPSPRRSRRWIGFFVVLAILAAVAIVVPVVYNLSIQLHPKQVADARKLWQEKKIPNYDLEYLIKTNLPGKEVVRAFLVQVREGKVVVVVDSGDMVYLDPSLAGFAGTGVLALTSIDPSEYGIAALFDELEAALRHDESARPRNFSTAQFDPTDGHPYHYVRRVSGTRERIEWHIKLTRLSDDTSPR